ncbi:hypothetical protein HII17_00560 [Thalassotalea sp. M1531]|uniref:Uncharacterized protein n=1 Tax=Thalassotalea algicola TaxID=2716224 RepID=A0A7Y0L926_9GAMM|nr:hypothetical protein [Thalassotalea algicola]NMP30037.1 hypothetical protein [Thalassotalea algicola]
MTLSIILLFLPGTIAALTKIFCIAKNLPAKFAYISLFVGVLLVSIYMYFESTNSHADFGVINIGINFIIYLLLNCIPYLVISTVGDMVVKWNKFKQP